MTRSVACGVLGLLLGCSGDSPSGNLIRVDDENAGSNCAAGGLAVRTGVDGDGNGVLADSEIVATNYVCNGGEGAMGTGGVMGTPGEQGPVGPQGAPGDPGAPGTPGSDGVDGADGFGLAWFDSGGQRLERARSYSEMPHAAIYFDAAGFAWRLNPSTGEFREFANTGFYRVYESFDCTGPEYIQIPDGLPAGSTFERQPDDGQVWARDFDAPELMVMACSQRGFNGGACGGMAGCPSPYRVIAAADAVLVTLPTLPLLPPFHLGMTP